MNALVCMPVHSLDAIHRHFHHSGCRRVGRQCQYLERHPHSHAHALTHRERGGEAERFELHEILEIISTVSERERLRTNVHTYSHTCKRP